MTQMPTFLENSIIIAAHPDDESLAPTFNFLTHSQLENCEHFACSPLNYSNIITAKVILIQDSSKYILEDLSYGPVQIEESLVSSAEFGMGKTPVKFLFGKNG